MWYARTWVRRVVLLDTDSGTAENASLLGAKTVLLPLARDARRAAPSVVLAMPEATWTSEVKPAPLSISYCTWID